MGILRSLKNAAIIAFNEVYPEDGNSHRVYWDLLNKFAAFMGIPNRKIRRDQPQTWLMLLRDFAGLQYEVTPAKKWVNRFLAPFVFIFNFFHLCFQLAFNILKIVTEFLPLFLSQFLLIQSESIDKTTKTLSDSQKGANLLSAVLLFLGLLFHGVYFIGRSITSPIEGVKKAWNYGYGSSSKSRKAPRIIYGLLFALLSILCTTLACIVLFPVAIKLLTPVLNSTMGFITTYLPKVGGFIQSVGLFIKPALTIVGNLILNYSPHLVVKFLGMIHASAELVALGALVGVSITILGTPISALLDVFKKWWHKPAPVALADSADINMSGMMGNLILIELSTKKFAAFFKWRANDMEPPEFGHLGKLDPKPSYFGKKKTSPAEQGAIKFFAKPSVGKPDDAHSDDEYEQSHSDDEQLHDSTDGSSKQRPLMVS